MPNCTNLQTRWHQATLGQLKPYAVVCDDNLRIWRAKHYPNAASDGSNASDGSDALLNRVVSNAFDIFRWREHQVLAGSGAVKYWFLSGWRIPQHAAAGTHNAQGIYQNLRDADVVNTFARCGTIDAQSNPLSFVTPKPSIGPYHESEGCECGLRAIVCLPVLVAYCLYL